ncbi:unnamed protein product [Sphagnum troendelagicum]|uniref:EF-hand domain-containing protein n=1 Tax=Sphagnum troendelagicum TaxID=128251 RepID=A0ABP0TYT0_9BRYO
MCFETGCSSVSSSSSSSSSRMQVAHKAHCHQANRLQTLSQMREAFDLLDRDGDGNIMESDLTEFLQISNLQNKTTSLSPDEIKRMIAVADMNGDGAVSFDEFHTLLQLQQEKNTNPFGAATPPTRRTTQTSAGGSTYLEDMFRVLDRNGDGVLCSEDLKQVMNTIMGQALSADDLAYMLATASTGGGSSGHDSYVSFQDFVRFMTTSPNLTKVF